ISRSSSSIATTSPYVRRMPLRRTAGTAAGRSSAGSAGACVANRLIQDRQATLQLFVSGRERRQQTDHAAVEAAREEHEAVLTRACRECLRRVAVALGQLEREHRAEAPHLADDRRVPGGDLVEPRAEKGRDLLGALAEARCCQLVEDGECR